MDTDAVKRFRKRFQELEDRASALELEYWQLKLDMAELRNELDDVARPIEVDRDAEDEPA